MAKATAGIITRPIETYKQRQKVILPFDNDRTASISSLPSPASQTHPSSIPHGPPHAGRGCMSTAGAIASASASGVGGFFKSYGRGFYVDIPLAVTEGFRAVPRLYGEKVPDHEPVHDWQSGARVGGTNLVRGVSEGFTDLFVQPYKGGKDGGAVGAAKGFGKGIVGMASKTASGKSLFISPRLHRS